MKMLLTSAGIANKSLVSALKRLVGKDFKQTTLAYIPTAANVEEGDKSWLVEDLNNLKNLGFSSLDIVDISALPKETWLPRINAADILVFGGGNTFYLSYWLRKSGLDKLLPDLLKSKVYVGVSAGSMVVSKRIFLSSDKPIFDENRMGITDDSGLNLINFYVRPHFNSPFFPKAKEDIIAQSAKTITETVYAIDDNTAIMLDGDNLEVITEGEYRKFN